MKLYEDIDRLLEGSGGKQREDARRVYRFIHEVLKKEKNRVLRRGHTGRFFFLEGEHLAYYASKDEWYELGWPLKEMTLYFVYKSHDYDGHEAGMYVKDGFRILINVYADSLVEFNRMMKDPAKELFHARRVFMHEYIHHLDYLKTDADFSKGYGRGEEDYYNQTIEVNAHFQEASAELEDVLRFKINDLVHALVHDRDPDPEMAWKVFELGLKGRFSSDRVERYYQEYFSDKFRQHISKENERRVKKRLYALRDDLMEYLSDQLKEVGLYDEFIKRGITIR